MNEPPIEHYLDGSAYIVPVEGGIAIETPLVRVHLTDELAGRLALNVMAARRRADKAAS